MPNDINRVASKIWEALVLVISKKWRVKLCWNHSQQPYLAISAEMLYVYYNLIQFDLHARSQVGSCIKNEIGSGMKRFNLFKQSGCVCV